MNQRLAERRVQVRTVNSHDPGYILWNGRPFDPSAWNWPTLYGRLVAAVRGRKGLDWYLLELEQEVSPHDLNPFWPPIEPWRSPPVRYLLLLPAPGPVAPANIPRDYIGETLLRGDTAKVALAVGRLPEQLPQEFRTPYDSQGYPGLCAGELKLADDDQSDEVKCTGGTLV